MIRDAVVFRSIPLVTSGLAFLPACGGGGNTTGDDDDTTGSPTTMTASDSSSEGNDTLETSTSDDPTTLDDSTSTTTDETTETGDPQCGAGTCGALPPIGWFGPTIYARVAPGDAPPQCPPEASSMGPTVLDGFADPGPAVCECTCELSGPQSCVSCAETATTQNGCTPNYYYGGSCPYNSITVTDDCTTVDILGWVGFVSGESNYYGAPVVMCEEEETVAIPPFAWEAQIATCRIPETALLCDTGVCIPPAPEGFESKWCIYQQGDIPCPEGEYPNKTIFWSDVEDTRGCTNCQCGSAAQSCEERDLLVFEGPDCAGDPIQVVEPNGVCVVSDGGSIAGTPSEAACPVTEAPVSMGSIAPTGAFTFCCNE